MVDSKPIYSLTERGLNKALGEYDTNYFAEQYRTSETDNSLVLRRLMETVHSSSPNFRIQGMTNDDIYRVLSRLHKMGYVQEIKYLGEPYVDIYNYGEIYNFDKPEKGVHLKDGRTMSQEEYKAYIKEVGSFHNVMKELGKDIKKRLPRRKK